MGETKKRREPKNALVLMGSPRPKGATAALVDCFVTQWHDQMRPEDPVQIIPAYEAALKPCIHCGYCKHTQGCTYDDFIPIDRAFQDADLLVVASPVFCLGFPAPLKAILDRTQQYYEAKFSLGIQKPVKRPKYALFLVTFGSSDSRGAAMMEEQLRLVFHLLNARLEHTIMARNTDTLPLDRKGLEDACQGVLQDFKTKMNATNRG
ncbi:MAG: NAD(P)H-dependent oxidoreductase [Treponema sp.]|jgi:multimeric flavodoxin WrbA|nr:NAD(P)H-dependent oxidoreductase [Treponema sp.]